MPGLPKRKARSLLTRRSVAEPRRQGHGAALLYFETMTEHESRAPATPGDAKCAATKSPPPQKPPTTGIPQPRDAAHLVHRVQRGDAAAEMELVERYSRGILFLLRRLTRDPTLAEDLHQETFRVVLERLRSRGLEDGSGLSPFLQGTARKLYLNDSRKRRRRQTEAAGDDLPDRQDPSPSPLDATLQREHRLLLRRFLAELRPERDRHILYRFYLAEEDKEAICRDLGLSGLQFNRVLHRARGRFKSLLDGLRKPLETA